LQGIVYDSQGLRIGSMAKLEELAGDANVRREYPGLARAASEVGSPQIRHTGTVGGNLCQRPRCWYYRQGHGLLAVYDGKAMAPAGDNRYHAILNNSDPAYFVSPSSLGPILIALNAKLRLASPRGTRDLPVEQFFVIPKTEGEREHDLKPDEIVTEVLVPPAQGTRSGWYEVRQRKGMDWPLALAGVALKMSGSQVESARVIMGQVAPIPWRSTEAEQALQGKSINESVADAAGKAAVSKATPLSRNKYKVQLARVAVKRAVLAASGMTA